jgi:hypothetical protein
MVYPDAGRVGPLLQFMECGGPLRGLPERELDAALLFCSTLSFRTRSLSFGERCEESAFAFLRPQAALECGGPRLPAVAGRFAFFLYVVIPNPLAVVWRAVRGICFCFSAAAGRFGVRRSAPLCISAACACLSADQVQPKANVEACGVAAVGQFEFS